MDYRLIQVPDDRPRYQGAWYWMVEIFDQQWQPFIHPRRSGPYYDASLEQLARKDVLDIHPGAIEDKHS